MMDVIDSGKCIIINWWQINNVIVNELIEYSRSKGISDDPLTINEKNSWKLRTWRVEKYNESSIKKFNFQKYFKYSHSYLDWWAF